MLTFKSSKGFGNWLIKNNYDLLYATVENQMVDQDMYGETIEVKLFVSIEVISKDERRLHEKYFVVFETKTMGRSIKIWDSLEPYM